MVNGRDWLRSTNGHQDGQFLEDVVACFHEVDNLLPFYGTLHLVLQCALGQVIDVLFELFTIMIQHYDLFKLCLEVFSAIELTLSK